MGEGMEKSGGGGIELPRELANVVMPSMRQGLIIINDSREAEGIVQFFTGMIIDKDPNKIIDWRAEYISVSNKEFQEELKLLAMPLVHEMSIMRAVVLPDGREYPVIMRKIYVLLLAPPVGFIIFGQPSIALIVNDTNKIYFGYKGIDVDTGGKVAVTIKAKVTDHMAIPFTPAIARFVFVGDVVETMIDSNGQVKGLKR